MAESGTLKASKPGASEPGASEMGRLEAALERIAARAARPVGVPAPAAGVIDAELASRLDILIAEIRAALGRDSAD